MLLDADWPNDVPPPSLAIDPVQWANLMTLARHANDQLVAASKAQAEMVEQVDRFRVEFEGLDDDALRFRLGEESLAFSWGMNANIAGLTVEQRAEAARLDNERAAKMAAIRAEMQRRGIYDPQHDYTWAVRQKWREEESARNAERAARISKWLPWRAAREKDYGI